ENKRCAGLLKKYRAAIEKSRDLMKDLGVIEICSSCADERLGGCCYYGVETWYSKIVLLMNLLMGIEIQGTRKFEKNCLFVDEKGCRLKARFNPCIHHLCQKIRNTLSHHDFLRLRAVTNHEIKLGVRAESAVRDFIKPIRL
ncbi:hypothetical protein ACFL6W_10155, partial [Thermodesulfobacteriota bacterium]